MSKELIPDLAWAGGIIALSLAATLLLQGGYIDNDTAVRVVSINGLMIAWYGNRLPKTIVPNAQARQVARVGGWSLVISGLIYAGFWAFAPIPMAVIGGCGAVLFGIAVTIAYSFLLCAKAKTV